MAAAVACAAALGLATGPGPYPPSMVATPGQPSNMLPTAAPLVLVGALQLALALAARPRVERWLRRPRPWSAVVAVNAVAVSTYLWHMPVVVGLVLVHHRLLGSLPTTPDAAWWWWRPAWAAAVVAGLLVALAVVAPLELRRRRGAPLAPPGG